MLTTSKNRCVGLLVLIHRNYQFFKWGPSWSVLWVLILTCVTLNTLQVSILLLWYFVSYARTGIWEFRSFLSVHCFLVSIVKSIGIDNENSSCFPMIFLAKIKTKTPCQSYSNQFIVLWSKIYLKQLGSWL